MDDGPPVTCSDPHLFEAVTEWRRLDDWSSLETECKRSAAAYVAGPVDILSTRLSTRWLTRNNPNPEFRCFVASDTTLVGSVYQLGGAPLPTK